MTSMRNARPIFYIALAFVVIGWMLLPGCSHAKHSFTEEPVVIEDPFFPEDTVPAFWNPPLVFHKEDVLLLPISSLIPEELLLGAPELPTVVQLGPFFFPMFPLQAGLYSDFDQQYELFLLEDTVYTAVPLDVLELLEYDFVLSETASMVLLREVSGALVYQPQDNFISIGALHLWSVN